MRVSVITPAYEAQTFIARAVRSVLAQTHDGWEMVIVADDGQDYRAILAQEGIADTRLRFASTGETAAGPSTARNIALNLAKHSIISGLDADDAYSENFLETLIPVVKEHGAFNAAMRMVDASTGEAMPLRHTPAGNALLKPPAMMRYSMGYSNIAFDRARCRAIWPEGFYFAEDLLFWFRLLDDVPCIAHNATAHYDCYYREGSLSRPSDTRVMCRDRERMIAHLETDETSVRNKSNREFLIRWLRACNAIEPEFDYRFVEPEVHLAAIDKYLQGVL